MIEINIAKDYTKTPGGRFKKEGEFSGEDFREKILIPKYLESEKKGVKLRVNLDGGYGYGSSFLEESFGGLVRQLKKVNIDNIIIISEEEPKLIDDIKNYIKDALSVMGVANND